MTNHTITTTVTFDDMIAAHEAELAELREAYDDLVEYAAEEYGDHRGEWPESVRQYAGVFDEQAKTLQSRVNALETLADEWGGDTFEIAMLTGDELSEVSIELRLTAEERGVEVTDLRMEMKKKTVDAATVDAPANVPRENDSPTPSQCPGALIHSLHEQVERLNQSGTTDFRAAGFADAPATSSGDTSAPPTPSGTSASVSDQTPDAVPSRGNDTSPNSERE